LDEQEFQFASEKGLAQEALECFSVFDVILFSSFQVGFLVWGLD
jgi:hypothetical protein